MGPENNEIKRRSFLQATMAAMALSACGREQTLLTKLPEPSEWQRLGRRAAPSTVAVLEAKSYAEDLFVLLKQNIAQLEISDLKNKRVILKPNMVECPPGKPATTHPAVLKAVIQLVDWLGAKEVLVAEGPGHMRDTDYILAATGIGKLCKEMSVPFVDLNLDDVVKVPLEEGFSHLDHFYLPKTIVNADAVVSVPKMKTHHWVGITGAMKNLFGIVPGRKYGYPKNLLHFKGIPQCILDLNRLVKTKLSVVDAIVAMEGDGPVNGIERLMGLIVIGTDPAAVDATCARIMGFELEELDYIQTAGKVIGNVVESEIKVMGSKIKDVAVQFKRPVTYLKDKKVSEKILRDEAQSGAS